MLNRTILVGAFVAILGGVFTTCEHRDNTPDVDPGSTVKSPVQTKEQPQVGLPTTQLTLGSGVLLMIDLALTQPQREKGLMFRTSLDANSGMLFVYPKKKYRTFWMKNTHIPLSIAFLSDQGKILQIEDREPFDETNQAYSRDQVHFVLEVNQGWFQVYKIGVGDKIKGVVGLVERAK